jgi:hypothetical protein
MTRKSSSNKLNKPIVKAKFDDVKLNSNYKNQTIHQNNNSQSMADTLKTGLSFGIGQGIGHSIGNSIGKMFESKSDTKYDPKSIELYEQCIKEKFQEGVCKSYLVEIN